MEHPRQRELRRRDALRVRQLLDALHEVEVLLEVLSLEARRVAAVVVRLEVVDAAEASRQKAAAERTVGDEADAERVRELLDVLDDGAAATDELLRLTRWVAEYYVCGWGEVLRAALPTGLDVSTEHRVTRTDVPPGDWATHPKGAPVLETLEKHASLTLAALRQRVPHATLALVRRLERDGLVRLDSGTSAPRVAIRCGWFFSDISGIETNDQTGEVTLNLTGPDGTILNVLAMNFAGFVNGETSNVLGGTLAFSGAAADATAATPVGSYDIKAELQGFKTADRKGIAVSVATAVDVPLALEVGSMTEAVKIAHEIGFPVILKPLAGNQGRGISPRLDSEDAVRAAWGRTVAGFAGLGRRRAAIAASS